MNIREHIRKLCIEAFKLTFPNDTSAFNSESIEVTAATQDKFGHYQCNSAMKFAKILKIAPQKIASQVSEKLLTAEEDTIFAKVEVAGPGFLNITLKNNFLEKQLKTQIESKKLGANETEKPLRVVIDYSSPNTAKEMHVGHLRTTIIGDCIARLLEFCGHEVLRLNHIGDWGTQFGMLIAYLKDKYQSANLNTELDRLNLTDLKKCYQESKLKFDSDEEFKKSSQLEVVKLQQHEPESEEVWLKICEISRKAYQEIYDVLGIEGLIERGESFYNPMLQKTIDLLEQKGVVTVSDGAKCIYLDGYTNRDGDPLPLIIQKSDGGYNYATTDLAAVKHRVEEEKADWIIYVVDAGQSQHFDMVFDATREAGFYNPSEVRMNHVPFGLVLKSDGKKFKTRSGDTERLIDVINNAIAKAREILQERNEEISEEELKRDSKIFGINAIKYADLSTNRTSDYKFSYEKMLQFEGNTAAFLNYAYVRAESIKRKINIEDINSFTNNNSFLLEEPSEIDLGLHLLRFSEAIDTFTTDLYPHRLAEYLFKLAEKFHGFFHNCRVEGHDKQNSRLMLCEATARTLEVGFKILGLTTLEKM